MSADLYDLLVGHEVGHAWDTPPEGWHTAIEKNGKGFKSFLNVVEDARIEKNIKNRYPGLKGPFYKAYKELFDNDFFGISNLGLEMEDLKLIDRLNLHFKIGPFLNVPFLPDEKHFVERMSKTNSWEEVYQLATELYTYHKDHDTRINLDDIEDYDSSDGFDDFEDLLDNNYDGSEGLSRKRGNKHNDDPSSITDENFREKEKDLISGDSKPFVYCNLPILNPKDYIITYKELYEKVSFSKIDNFPTVFLEMYQEFKDDSEKRNVVENMLNPVKLVKEYKERNVKFIQYLVKEFELKRNASQFSRAKVSKSGELDLDKVWAYKFKDDLFKRVTKIPKGKNHGMVMFIDWSGSMSDNLTNTIEQFLILTDFCRKVSIPFEVYAFSDNARNLFREQNEYIKDNKYLKDKDLFIDADKVKLLNFLSSSMSSNEYRNAQIRLLQIAEIYRYTGKSKYADFNYFLRNTLSSNALPKGLSLGGTPLNESIILASYIIPMFKTMYKLDITNTIFLTDGDGTDYKSMVNNGSISRFNIFANSKHYNIIIRDTQTGLVSRVYPNEPTTIALLKLLKLRTETNLVGYFISGRNIRSTIFSLAQHYNKFISIDDALKFYRKNKYYGITDLGYDNYFILTNKDMEITDFTLDIGTDNSKNALKKAFISNQKNKFLNRTLISRFVEQIA
ncbi:hypothetical protein EBU95_08800 [bacterium]|nr:hypothetical protein [bacterium]